jgi:replication initiator protein RepSA
VTAATVPLTPGLTNSPGAWESADDTVWHTECAHPIPLRGHIAAVDLATGELATMYDTSAEPGGVLLTPCGNRRESVCPACSQVYKGDARQLVRAGLTGGKGVPESITAHPCVFATFTAPSFGPVHARRLRGRTVLPCRPRRDARSRRCPHGRDISCPARHAEHDPRLGRALCPDCYDYRAAVLFNAHAGALWRRFTTYMPRHLARLAGITQKELRAWVRVRYVKVAEYQARGVVHFHAVIRLDGVPLRTEITTTDRYFKVDWHATDEGPGNAYQPPPDQFTADLLCAAIKQAAAAVTVPVDTRANPGWPALTLRFGAQVDTKPIRRDGDELPGTGRKLSVQAVGNYIAKYATKSLDAPGLPDRPLRAARDLDGLRCHRHYRRMIETAWRLGGGIYIPANLHGTAYELGGGRYVPARSRLCKWAHTLGHGGHFLTKSRRYSTTFTRLRRDRQDHRRAQRHPAGEHDPWGRPLDDTVVLVLHAWTYAGPGLAAITPAAELALASADMARGR